jgi:TetR/AcrR family transcriptional regulator, regulator of biofilm formation and stress response
MRARRHDPYRRDRILDAALEVIADNGVAGTTHRAIAARADVPLGSLTYHFSGLEDLLARAFERHAEQMSVLYAAHFEEVRTQEQFVDAVTDLVLGNANAHTRDWVTAYELYVAALRDPALRVVTDRWMRTSRKVLERHIDPDTARAVVALVEGLVLHKTLSTSTLSRQEIRSIIQRAIPA